MSARPRLRPEKGPGDCLDWLSEEQAVDLVRRAYRLAAVQATPPEGQPFIEPHRERLGTPVAMRRWSTRASAWEVLRDNVAGALAVAADDAGVPGFHALAKRHRGYVAVLGHDQVAS